ncbi:MAG: hypothetical protein ABW168_08945 [Sedimenticola sp.]
MPLSIYWSVPKAGFPDQGLRHPLGPVPPFVPHRSTTLPRGLYSVADLGPSVPAAAPPQRT